jgi:hypothetical protein
MSDQAQLQGAELPGPTIDRLILAGVIEAICRTEPPKRRRRFLQELEAVAIAYDELGNVVRIGGTSPMRLGDARRGAAVWLRVTATMARRQLSRLVAG